VDRLDIVGRSIAHLQAAFTTDGPQHVAYRTISTHFQQLRVAEFRVSNATIEGGSVVGLGSDIILASPHGGMSYLDADYHIQALGPPVPMNFEELRQSPLYRSPTFMTAALRTMDLLVLPTAEEGRYELYATHDRFTNACIQFVVSRIILRRDGEALAAEGAWSDVWTARNCLRFEDRGAMVGYPPYSGGRMVRLNNDEILVSVGDYGHVGATDRVSVAMDPEHDFGKIVALNIRTGHARQLASGLKNPQGLTIDRSGRIWETEHGPQGGDEINLITEGANYGWPYATYGMDYTSPPRRWPGSPRVSPHEGYARPRFAFVPAIGISAIAQPDPREFPNWADSLLVSGLRSQSLFVARLEGDDIVFVEPIPLEHRLRDLAVLDDGRLAILADRGILLLMSNADDASGTEIEVTGLNELPPLGFDETWREVGTDVDWGRGAFESVCASCHSVTGQGRAGPPLDGIVGRDIASVEGYPYTNALRRLDGAWTERRLAAFILNPDAFAHGTAMPSTHLSPQASRRVASYLASAPAVSTVRLENGAATP